MPVASNESQVISTSVLSLQKGLYVASQQDQRIPSPGSLDGLWGPNTARSYQVWASLQPDTLGNIGLPQEPAQRDRNVMLHMTAWSVLYTLAEIFDAQHGTSQQGTPAAQQAGTGTAIRSNGSALATSSGWQWLGLDWWIWLLIGVGAAGIGGGLYWYYKKSKKRR